MLLFSQKASTLSPYQILHLITDSRVCQWTVTQVRVCSGRTEGNHGLSVIPLCSPQQRRVVETVHHVDICVCFQQDRHCGRVVSGSIVESGDLGGKWFGVRVTIVKENVFYSYLMKSNLTFKKLSNALTSALASSRIGTTAVLYLAA